MPLPIVYYKRLRETGGIENPPHGSAGYDLRAAVDVFIEPQGKARVPTGVAVSIPDGYVGLVRGRSGLAFGNQSFSGGVFVFEGTIDASYRGEIAVLIINTTDQPVFFPASSRIAQLVIGPCLTAPLFAVHDLDPTERGEQGFGSSGLE